MLDSYNFVIDKPSDYMKLKRNALLPYTHGRSRKVVTDVPFILPPVHDKFLKEEPVETNTDPMYPPPSLKIAANRMRYTMDLRKR